MVFLIALSRETVEENIKGEWASRRWVYEYLETNKLITLTCRHLKQKLEDKGYKAVYIAPTGEFNPETPSSPWSHRHAGYVAGLGTFGVHNLLITRFGTAVRLGTLITNASLPPTPRPKVEYCPEKRGVKCEVCLSRCPVNAFSDWQGEGKNRCYKRLEENAKRYIIEGAANILIRNINLPKNDIIRKTNKSDFE